MASEEKTNFVGMRVEDLPIPYVPSRKLTCHDCRSPMWMSEEAASNFSFEEVIPHCHKCAAGSFADGEDANIVLPDWELEELKKIAPWMSKDDLLKLARDYMEGKIKIPGERYN